MIEEHPGAGMFMQIKGFALLKTRDLLVVVELVQTLVTAPIAPGLIPYKVESTRTSYQPIKVLPTKKGS